MDDRGRVLRVLAGAGSGKTHTMIHVVSEAVEMGLAVGHRIAAITFTREAAASLAHRLNAIAPGLGRDVETGTFHSFAAKRHFGGAFLPTSKAYRIAETIMRKRFNGSSEERAFIMQVLNGEEEAADRIRAVLALVSYCRNWESASDDVLRRQYPKLVGESHRVRRLVMEYESAKGELVDFDDVLIGYRDALRDNAEFRAKMRERLDLLVVDEYQDMNAIQHEIVLLLTHPRHRGRAARLVVVGDERQSIYAFRGARPELFLDFADAYPPGHVATLTLTRNFRSTRRVLDAANALFPEHAAPLAPRPGERRRGRAIALSACRSLGAEAFHVVNAVLRLLRGGVAPGRIAVLARAKWQLAAIEKVITEPENKKKSRSRAASSPRDILIENIWRGTMHAAKGLEWDHVFIVGAQEGGIPNDRVLLAESLGAPEAVSSERRLFYVALTRARETCVVTYLATARGASRFVKEAGLAPAASRAAPARAVLANAVAARP